METTSVMRDFYQNTHWKELWKLTDRQAVWNGGRVCIHTEGSRPGDANTRYQVRY